jgi:hypothetical protein
MASLSCAPRCRLRVGRRSLPAAEELAKTFVDAGCARPELIVGDESVLATALARDDIDAVSVVLASHLQPTFALQALRAGELRECVTACSQAKRSA